MIKLFKSHYMTLAFDQDGLAAIEHLIKNSLNGVSLSIDIEREICFAKRPVIIENKKLVIAIANCDSSCAAFFEDDVSCIFTFDKETAEYFISDLEKALAKSGFFMENELIRDMDSFSSGRWDLCGALITKSHLIMKKTKELG